MDPPGAPGITPRWTSSDKSAVGTAANPESRIWFTVSHGILNEIYAPRLDMASIRDFGFVVTGRMKKDFECGGVGIDTGRNADHFRAIGQDDAHRAVVAIGESEDFDDGFRGHP